METAPRSSIQDLTRELILTVGEDPEREGLVRTPERVEASMKFLTRGYKQDMASVVNKAIFEEPYDEMVVLKDIDLFSLCEHHLLPFYGRCHVAYLPNGKIIGLSKIPRLVDMYAKRLQVQERLTNEIATSLMEILEPNGVAVVIEALHLCMAMRGVQKQGAVCTTSAMLGSFRRDERSRAEFLNLIGRTGK